MTTSAPAPPDWSAGSLASVLPAVADRLGVPRYSGHDLFDLPEARSTVVVLVDGLGHDLLRQRGGHAPFLRSRLATARRIPCGFPTTTATSMGSFGTGLPPGSHGLVGFQVLDPDTDRLLNQLSWEDGPDPLRWQPSDTVFEHAENAGVQVTRIGPGYFDGSGLTNAALRGGRFLAAKALHERVDASIETVRGAPRSLVYLYWGDLDKTGHVHGCQSWQWGDELGSIDRALADLAARVPAGTSIVVTADHGMVDIPFENRLDLADEPELMDGVRHLAGESRSLQLHVDTGAATAVRDAWQQRLGARATLMSRDEAIEAGWFGQIRDGVAARIGDLIVNMRGSFAIVHSGLMRPELVRLLGLHGSTSDAEIAIPVIAVPPR
ncbi:MAG: alkaline phosphatase family protein [Micrococcales bacterium]|nr:alkaline phosphatase family protein [Micrococcales bacterium]